MSSTETGLLTYTPGYGAELDNIQLNKIYCFDFGKCISYDSNRKEIIPHTYSYKGNSQYNPRDLSNCKFMFDWKPKEGEITFDLDDSITIIDFILIRDGYANNVRLRYIDNYGNVYSIGKKEQHTGIMIGKSDMLMKNIDNKILSDQVIDYIKDNMLVCNPTITTEHIKQIQNIAGMGREKTIKYVMEYPQRVVEVEYDINNIIKELVIAFPGCDPWEKAKELFEKYTDMVDTLTEEYKNDKEILGHLIHEKNNIYKMIMRNKDIDDDDLKELIAIKTSKMESAESQIEEILERNKERREKINKLNLLLCKLDATSIPEKTLTTEFI